MPAKGQRRKNQIINAAKEMFLERGYQSTHIGEVCDQLGIARGTVYQYFSNKRDIIYCILESIEEEFDDIFDQDDLKNYLKNDPGVDEIYEHLYSRFTGGIRSVLAEPIIIKLIYKEIPGLDSFVIDRLEKFVEYICKIIARDFSQVQEYNCYRKDIDPQIFSNMLVGSVLLMIHECQKRNQDILDKKIVTNMVEIFMRGIIK